MIGRIDVTVARARVKVVETLRQFGPATLRSLKSFLVVFNENTLDTALQHLRQTGQIHYAGPKVGWVLGPGAVYKPNQRFKWRRRQ